MEFELRQLEHFTTKTQARVRVAAWIEEYNHDRRHSSIGMVSPVAYELRREQTCRNVRPSPDGVLCCFPAPRLGRLGD